MPNCNNLLVFTKKTGVIIFIHCKYNGFRMYVDTAAISYLIGVLVCFYKYILNHALSFK